MAHRNTVILSARHWLSVFTAMFILMTAMSLRMEAQPAVGSVNGALTVSEMGAAVYSVTFDVPGSGRMAPQVGLAYNSQSAGYGLAGYGIDVTGLSVITAGGRDMFHNGRVKGANYDGDGNLYLDGKRLVLQSGDDGMDGAVYAPEGDPHTKVTQHGSYGVNSVPTFEVSTKDGGRIVYGGDAGSRFEFSKNGTLCCSAWYISRAENKYGEGMAYNYTKENLCMRPKSITYGRGGASCKVEFNYRQMQLGNERRFRLAGQQGVNDKMLDYVTTSMNGSVYRRYDFQYDETASDNFSRLTMITESNGAGESLNPTILTWNMPEVNMEINHTDNTDVPQRLSDWRGYDDDKNAGYMTVDLNGDGISDIIRLCSGKRGIEGINDWINYVAAYVHTGYIDMEGQVRYKEPLMYWFPAQLANWPAGCYPVIKNSTGSTAVMDFDGDGLNDLVFPYYTDYGGVKYEKLYILYGKYVKSRYNSYRLQGINVTLERTDGCPPFTIMDLNGDGRDDIIVLETATGVRNKFVKFITCTGQDSDGNPILDVSSKEITLSSRPKFLFTGDYNNDGLTDLFVACESGYDILYNNGYSKDHSILDVFSENNKRKSASFKDQWRMSQGDFNGDGQVDFLYFDKKASKFGIAYNNGNGEFRNQTLQDNWGVYEQTETNFDDNKFVFTVTDFDNDGKSDVLISKAMYKRESWWNENSIIYDKTLVRWLRSTGSGFELAGAYEFNGDDESNEGMFMAGDFDGDGRIETANYGACLDANYSMDASDVLHIYRTGNDGASTGRLASVTDGFGNTTTLNYAYATDKAVYGLTEQPKPNTYWEWDEQGNRVRITEPSINIYPVNRYTLPTVLVSAVRTQDADIHYTYKDLRLHIAGRGMLGFGTVEKTNNTLGVTETTEVSKWNLQLYQPQEILTTTKILVTGETATTRSKYMMTNRGMWYKGNDTHTDYDGKIYSNGITYDNETGQYSGSENSAADGWNEKFVSKDDEYFDFIFVGGSWNPTQREIITRYEDEENYTLSYEDYTYDDMGNRTSVTITGTVFDEDELLYVDGESIRTDYTYDDMGNMLSESFQGNDKSIGHKYYEYDSTGRFVVKTYTVPESTTTTYTYDQWGHLLTETDRTNASHPLTIRHEYDNWGRRTKSIFPDGTETVYFTDWEDDYNIGGWFTEERHTAAPTTRVTYDSRGREVMSSTIGPEYVNISKCTAYNEKGQVATVTNTYGKRTTTETFTYDARGRVITDTHSSGAGITYEYGKNTVTTTDAAGRSVTKTYNAWGDVKKVGSCADCGIFLLQQWKACNHNHRRPHCDDGVRRVRT